MKTLYKISVYIPEYNGYMNVAYKGYDKDIACRIAESYARAGKRISFDEQVME